MPYSFQEATVVNIINETPVVKRYFIQPNGDVPFTYKAGQFVMLDLPIECKIHTRSYSIASAPDKSNVFELCIVLKPGGLGTEYLFANTQVGSGLKISQALGKFALPELIDRDLCFICTGTGIAPLRSMLLQLLKSHKSHKNLYLIFGNRFERDILYRAELEQLQQELDHFTFIPVLSRESEWSGVKGYVHEVYEQIFADKRPAYFYICGWAEMLKEARHRLEDFGYDKSFIKFESYD